MPPRRTWGTHLFSADKVLHHVRAASSRSQMHKCCARTCRDRLTGLTTYVPDPTMWSWHHVLVDSFAPKSARRLRHASRGCCGGCVHSGMRYDPVLPINDNKKASFLKPKFNLSTIHKQRLSWPSKKHLQLLPGCFCFKKERPSEPEGKKTDLIRCQNAFGTRICPNSSCNSVTNCGQNVLFSDLPSAWTPKKMKESEPLPYMPLTFKENCLVKDVCIYVYILYS